MTKNEDLVIHVWRQGQVQVGKIGELRVTFVVCTKYFQLLCVSHSSCVLFRFSTFLVQIQHLLSHAGNTSLHLLLSG